MFAYRYMEEGTRRVAFTPDAGGRCLPVGGSVWLFAGPVDLDPRRAGRSPTIDIPPRVPAPQVKAGFLHKGYFLWPDDADPGEPRSFMP